jgi:hypothetical protein
MGQIPEPRSSIARRLRLALATMLLPVAAVAGAGLITFRLSISALELHYQPIKWLEGDQIVGSRP